MATIERKTKRYPTDLTDEEWERIAPLLPEPAKRGRKPEVDMREVLNAIRAHHDEEPHLFAETFLVTAADAISGSRPGARREMFESYVKRLEQLEEIAMGLSGVERCFAIQAGRELRIMVQPERVTDADLSTPIEDLELLERAVAQGAHIAIGSRALGESQVLRHQPRFREWSGRLVNLVGAWHQQLIELLGAMGIREVRRLRGETGRCMFFEDLERETFGRLFGKRKDQ